MPRPRRTATLVALALACAAATAHATFTEADCQKGRHYAAAKYESCQQKAIGKLLAVPIATFQTLTMKCRTKYASAWATLQLKASGTGNTCDAPRWVDNGDNTVTDNLTALQWEKKSNFDLVVNLADPHDGDNKYTWSPAGSAANGTAYTSFLTALNGACFAGQCDWRLPDQGELQSIFVDPCTSGPCIDGTFGPTAIPAYWTSTTLAEGATPDSAWIVNFNGFIGWQLKTTSDHVRAVRGGL